MARFKIINNTTSDLPLSDSSFIRAQEVKIVEQMTLELKRLEQKGFLMIVTLPDLFQTDDTNLVPDYIGVRDPREFGAGNGTTLDQLLPANAGSIPEFNGNEWKATTRPSSLVLDGGNF
jgi:hypothetical protein